MISKNVFDFNDFLSSITYFYEEFSKDNGVEENRALTIETKLQPKGRIELYGFFFFGVLAITGIISLSMKSSFKIDNKGEKIKKSLIFLKNKAKTLEDIFNNAQYLIKNKIQISSEDIKLLDSLSKTILKDFLKEFEKLSNINKENLEKIINNLIKSNKTNFKGVGQPLRIALVGSKFGPGIYDIILSLDKNEVVQRLKAAN